MPKDLCVSRNLNNNGIVQWVVLVRGSSEVGGDEFLPGSSVPCPCPGRACVRSCLREYPPNLALVSQMCLAVVAAVSGAVFVALPD
jgi:hypothetical protein